MHTQIVTDRMQTIPHSKILNRTPPDISETEQALPHYTRRFLTQLHTNKSPILHTYLHKIAPETHPTPNCLLSPMPLTNTRHQTHIWLPKDLSPEALWDDHGGAAELLVVPAGAGMRREGHC